MLPLPRTVSTALSTLHPYNRRSKKNSFLRSMPPGLSARCGTVIPSFFVRLLPFHSAVSRLHSPRARFCRQ